jgi:hypothetical protein
VNSNISINVAWTAPFNGGSGITAYKILIRHSDNVTFTENKADCDGSEPSIMAVFSCTIPITSLLVAPYNLPWGSHVYAKIVAVNVVGQSVNSP